MQKLWIIIVFLLFKFHLFSQAEWNISGTIKDTAGHAIDMVIIKVIDSQLVSTSDRNGNFKLSFSESKDYIVSFSKMNYATKELLINNRISGKNIDIILDSKDIQIDEILISDQKMQENNLLKIETRLLNNIPSVSGDQIQTLVKTMPGVASGNELSSNYSVRGGNFDENLVYINGIEIFRPALLQSGQQEGLNMANPDLVSKIEFSSGGFGAIYDDKMSSVLDIQYRQPTTFKAGTSLSMLGASAFIEGNHFNKKFSHLTGFRYKNARYLLKTLDTKGEYKPNFIDMQTLLSYKFTEKLKVSALAYHANNNYLFFPEDRTTTFGTTNEALNLYIDFEGKEHDKFNSLMGALIFDYQPTNKINLILSSTLYDNHEALNFDIEGRYSLNQLDKQLGSSSFGDSILNLGIGRFIDHARSSYNVKIYSFHHSGKWQTVNNFVQWGVKYQSEFIENHVNEWKMLDSAGYSIPYTGSQLELSQSWYSDKEQKVNRFSSYIQSSYRNPGFIRWNLVYGIRYSYNSLNDDNMLSPRLSIGWNPSTNKKLYFKLGGGIYYQSVILRDLIDRQGYIYSETKTPFSIQFSASGNYDFSLMERPFHFKAALYYKSLKKIIPYSVNNIRNIYYPGQTAYGYVSGIDLRLNGEFVGDTESWLSISLMKSGINIEGDTIGMQALPNDHFANISLFFQDYIPGNKRFKMYLALYYLSGSPFGPPNNTNYYAPLRITDYKRVDIGFSILLKTAQTHSKSQFSRFFKHGIFNIEIFNLLGINNTISYNWVTVVPNSSIIGNDQYSSFAVPNRLSSRRLNLRLIISF